MKIKIKLLIFIVFFFWLWFNQSFAFFSWSIVDMYCLTNVWPISSNTLGNYYACNPQIRPVWGDGNYYFITNLSWSLIYDWTYNSWYANLYRNSIVNSSIKIRYSSNSRPLLYWTNWTNYTWTNIYWYWKLKFHYDSSYYCIYDKWTWDYLTRLWYDPIPRAAEFSCPLIYPWTNYQLFNIQWENPIAEPELPCDTVLINYPYADSYQFDTWSIILYDRDNVELNDYYGFSYEKNWARFEENLSNVKNVDDFTWSLDFNNLTSSWIVFWNLVNPLSDFPILHIHSPDVWLSYLSMRWHWVKFKITDCSYYKDEQDDFFHLTDFDDIKEMYEVPVWSFISYNENPPLYMYDFFHKFGNYVNDICLVFDRNSSLNYVAIIEKLDYWQMTPQLIESEVCYDQENDVYYVDGEEYEWDPQDIQDPWKIDLIDNVDFFWNTDFNYSTSWALDLNLPVYWWIYYKDENLKTCYMFNNDWDFLYTVANIFSIDFTLSETTDNDILKLIFFVPDLIVWVMQDAINSVFWIIWSFWKIEEWKDYCYLWTVYQVHYQSFFPEWWDVISSLEAYRVDSWEKTVVDYIFLFFYSFFMFSVLYLLFKNY